jgi:hypothetical protein
MCSWNYRHQKYPRKEPTAFCRCEEDTRTVRCQGAGADGDLSRPHTRRCMTARSWGPVIRIPTKISGPCSWLTSTEPITDRRGLICCWCRPLELSPTKTEGSNAWLCTNDLRKKAFVELLPGRSRRHHLAWQLCLQPSTS